MNITKLGIVSNISFNSSYNNLLTFSNINEQFNYFNSKCKFMMYDNFSYLRNEKSTPIRVDIEADELFDCNYIMYQNSNYSNKWFYGFINSVEYRGDGISFIYFSEDIFQSWQFEYNFKKCFVEREHVTDDTRYNNTIPENIETGDLVITSSKNAIPESITGEIGSVNIFVGVTTLPYSDDFGDELKTELNQICSVHNPGFFGGSLNGLYFLDCGNIILQDQNTISGKLNSIMDIYTRSKVSTINAVSMIFLSFPFPSSKFSNTYNIDGIENTYVGYTPSNNKLYCYPYCYEEIISPSGSTILKYENMVSSTSIKCSFTFGPNSSFGIWVDGYSEFTKFGSLNKVSPFPMGSWTFDAWASWVQQNGLSYVIGLASQTIGLGSSIVSMNPFSIASGITGIGQSMAQTMAKTREADKLVGSASSPDFWFATQNIGWYPVIVRKQVKAEYARSIDEYFSRYGYKVNRVKIPNINTRNNFNYVKTNGAIISGNVPEYAINKMCEIMDSGVTFWHNQNIGG